MKIWIKHADGTIFSFLIDLAYSAPSSTLTIYGGTDFSQADPRIIEPYF